MRTNVGALSALCVAITAAIAAPASGAEMAHGTQPRSAAQSVQGQGDKSSQATARKKTATNSQSQNTVTTLGTVTVTATRRTETLQNVPMAISVVTYHDIQRKHMQDFEDYVGTIPGLNYVSSGPGNTELSIRGIASGANQPAASVGVYIDDTPYGSSSVFATGASGIPDLDPNGLARIEVLRGPQGTLYGAGSLSGVIRFITIPPDTGNYAGRLQVDGTSVSGGGNGFGVHGMVNLPLVTDKLAIRANAYDRTDPGFIDDAALDKTDVNESRVKGGRVSLLWTPTDKTSLRLLALAQNLTSDGSPTEALDPATGDPLYGDLQQRIAADTGAFYVHNRLYNATFKTDLGWATLMSSSSYSTLDSLSHLDATPLLFLGPQANGQPYGTLELTGVHQTRTTEEIRLTSPKSQRVEWLTGVFYDHQTAGGFQHVYPSDYFSGTPLPSPFGIPIGDVNPPSTYDAYAAYGNVTWHVTDRFDLEAGLRYSHDRQHYTEIGSGVAFGSPTPVVLVDKGSSDSTTTFSFSPKFHINDTTMLYARVASGFIPGGPNVVPVGVANVPKTFSPTKLTSYELGFKSTWLNDRLSADLSAYYIDWTKIPLSTYLNGFTFLSNGGQAESRGFEATIAYAPARGWKLSLNTSYSDPKLTKDNPPPSNGKDGDRLPYTPKWDTSLSADYDFPLSGNWHGFVGASYEFIGTREGDFTIMGSGVSRIEVPAYHRVDLRAGVDDGLWTLSVYAKNVTNERGILLTGAGTLNPVTGKVEANASIITPRMFGISVSRNF